MNINWCNIMVIGNIIGVFAVIVGVIVVKTGYFSIGQIIGGLGMSMYIFNKLIMPELIHEKEWSKY